MLTELSHACGQALLEYILIRWFGWVHETDTVLFMYYPDGSLHHNRSSYSSVNSEQTEETRQETDDRRQAPTTKA